MARRRTKEEIFRTKNSAWILFMENGYMLYTACSECGKMAYCRGKERQNMKCKECHYGNTFDMLNLSIEDQVGS